MSGSKHRIEVRGTRPRTQREEDAKAQKAEPTHMPELSRGIISYLKLSKLTVDEMPYNRNHSGLDVRLSEQEQSPGMVEKTGEREEQ